LTKSRNTNKPIKLKLTTPKNEKVFYLDGSLGESIDASSTKKNLYNTLCRL